MAMILLWYLIETNLLMREWNKRHFAVILNKQCPHSLFDLVVKRHRESTVSSPSVSVTETRQCYYYWMKGGWNTIRHSYFMSSFLSPFIIYVIYHVITHAICHTVMSMSSPMSSYVMPFAYVPKVRNICNTSRLDLLYCMVMENKRN